MSILDQIASLLILQIPRLALLFFQLFLSDNQSSQTLPCQSIALVLNVSFVYSFASLNHDHICSFKVKDQPVSTNMTDDDSHAFGLTREGKIRQNLVFLNFSVRGINNNLIFSSFLHEKTQLLSKTNQSDFIGTGGLQHTRAFIKDRSNIVADDQCCGQISL